MLIVESCNETRQLLVHITQEAGFEPIPCQENEEAWQYLKSGMIRLALIAYPSTQPEGLDVLRRLQDSARINHVYFIMLSNHWDSDQMVASLNSGASDYLAKPVKPGELSARLKVGSRLVQRQLQLSQSQKLETIGQMAAGVAHEINTPIQYVGDNLQFILDSISELVDWIDCHDAADQAEAPATQSSLDSRSQTIVPNAKKQTDIDWDYLRQELPLAVTQSMHGIQQVARIVSAMKGFSYLGAKEFRAVDLREVIDDAREVSRSQWKYVCDVQLNFPEPWPNIYGLKGEIKQVFLNLIVNAAHAVQDTHKETGKRGLISFSGQQEGKFVIVSISDTGCGIPVTCQNRIFDPFFTTKEVGKGTGQGLAMVHSIITQHGGTISFESGVGVGTTFEVRLPLDPRENSHQTDHDPLKKSVNDTCEVASAPETTFNRPTV